MHECLLHISRDTHLFHYIKLDITLTQKQKLCISIYILHHLIERFNGISGIMISN